MSRSVKARGTRNDRLDTLTLACGNRSVGSNSLESLTAHMLEKSRDPCPLEHRFDLPGVLESWA